MLLVYLENEASYGVAIPSRLITAKFLCVCSYPKLQIESRSHQSVFPPHIQNTGISCPEENLIPASSQTGVTSWCFSDVSPQHSRLDSLSFFQPLQVTNDSHVRSLRLCLSFFYHFLSFPRLMPLGTFTP